LEGSRIIRDKHPRLNPSCPPFTKGGIPLFEKEGLRKILKEYVGLIMNPPLILKGRGWNGDGSAF